MTIGSKTGGAGSEVLLNLLLLLQELKSMGASAFSEFITGSDLIRVEEVNE